MIEKEYENYKVRSRHIHLDGSSPFNRQHYANWRMKSALLLDQKRERDLRYSSAFSLSEKDASLLKEKIIKHLNEILAEVAQPPEEVPFALCLDFIGLNRFVSEF